jgi:hypothetical protein
MVSWKSVALLAPLAAVGGWVTLQATREIGRLEGEFRTEGQASQAEGASFVETFRHEHADRYLRALDRRREIAARITVLRRNRFLGIFAMVAAALGIGAASVFARISRDLEEQRRWLRSGGPPS